jgi:hypothetical protein
VRRWWYLKLSLPVASKGIFEKALIFDVKDALLLGKSYTLRQVSMVFGALSLTRISKCSYINYLMLVSLRPKRKCLNGYIAHTNTWMWNQGSIPRHVRNHGISVSGRMSKEITTAVRCRDSSLKFPLIYSIREVK